MLNESAARQLFPAGDAVGHRLRLTGRDQPWRTIAGVVGDVRQRSLDQAPRGEMFIPLAQFKHFSAMGQARALSVVLRTDADPLTMAASARAALRAVDPEVPAAQLRDMTTVIAASIANPRLNMVLMSSFGVLALMLAAIGIYGVMVYQVVQRTGEMGLRVALGASPGSVRSLIVREGMRLVAIGLGIGAIGALALGGLVDHLVFGVEPREFPTLLTSAALLAVVGFVASYIPAVRATRIDPIVALRSE